MKSDVYFIKVEANNTEQRVEALKRLLEDLNPFACYKKDEFVPLKITVGDSACIYHINPEFIKAVVSEIKKKGAKPFLFDTSVIYHGQRQNAVDHLNLAQSKGFGPGKVGAPFIIADGVFGQDGKEFHLDNSDIKKIKIPSFIGIVDSLVVLSHVTGHIVSGYAGAIKNVAMGMSFRPTKQMQHSSIKPSIIVKNCTACGCCVEICPIKAISFKDLKAFIDPQTCIGCGECICACKFDAVYVNYQEDPFVFGRRMAEVAHFILAKFKNKFYVNFTFDVTKECDCLSTRDENMVSANIGILASSDPVALDKATGDLAHKHQKLDFFSRNKKVYEAMFGYAAKKGLGSIEYNLVHI